MDIYRNDVSNKFERILQTGTDDFYFTKSRQRPSLGGYNYAGVAGECCLSTPPELGVLLPAHDSVVTGVENIE